MWTIVGLSKYQSIIYLDAFGSEGYNQFLPVVHSFKTKDI